MAPGGNDLQPEAVDRRYVVPGEFPVLGRGGGGGGCLGRGRRGGTPLRYVPGGAAADRRDAQEHQVWHARDQSHHPQQCRSDAQGLGIAKQLAAQLAAHILRPRHAGHDDRDRGRQQECRQLRRQPVTDCEQRVGARRGREPHAVAHGADGQATDHVDYENQDAGERIAAHELAGTVHGAVEVGLGANFRAAHARLVLVDEAAVQVGIDRHLLAGHRIESEAGADLGDTARALGDHHEVDDGEDHEHHDTDGEVAADHELPEGLDDVAGRLRTGVPVQQHDAGGGDVQRQAQQGGQEQHGREGAELDRAGDIEHRHDDDDRQRDVECEQQVQRQRRQRQHDHREDREHAGRYPDPLAEQVLQRQRLARGRRCAAHASTPASSSSVGRWGSAYPKRAAAFSWAR